MFFVVVVVVVVVGIPTKNISNYFRLQNFGSVLVYFIYDLTYSIINYAW